MHPHLFHTAFIGWPTIEGSINWVMKIVLEGLSIAFEWIIWILNAIIQPVAAMCETIATGAMNLCGLTPIAHQITNAVQDPDIVALGQLFNNLIGSFMNPVLFQLAVNEMWELMALSIGIRLFATIWAKAWSGT